MFLNAIEDDEYKNLFTFMLFVGAREGETLGLSWAGVDFQKGQISISQQLQKSKGKAVRIKAALEPMVRNRLITKAQTEKIVADMCKGVVGRQGYSPKLDKLVADKVISEDIRATVIKTVEAVEKESGSLDNTYYIASTKSGKGRVITVAPYVLEVLRDEKSKQLENRLRAGEAWENEHDLVFTNTLGGHLCAVTVYNRFKRIAGSIGLPDARPHDLRHSFITASLSNGVDIKTVQSDAGHSTASFTLDVYASATQQMKRNSADKMQKLIMEIKKQA